MAKTVDKIRHFRFWVQKTLPAVYDDSLSYYELLAKVVSQLNDVIDGHNGLVDLTGELADSVKALDKKVDDVATTIATFVDTVNKKFDDFKEEFTEEMTAEMSRRFEVQDARIGDLDTRVDALEGDMSDFKQTLEKEFGELENALTDTINKELVVLRAYVTTTNTELREWVHEQIEQLIHDLPDLQNVYVYDISTGELVSVQTALYNLYGYVSDGITAAELDKLGVDADDIDKWLVNSIPSGMRTLDFDTRGRDLLLSRYDYLVPSAVSGDMVRPDIYRAECDNIHRDMDSLTAEEFADYAVEGIEDYINSTDTNLTDFTYHNVLMDVWRAD